MVTDQIASLCESRSPLLIGVRHHSAAIACSIHAMLDAFKPDQLLVEMPADFNDWRQYLADDETVAPVAISAASHNGDLAFYPLADFSPELVAIRWAFKLGVPVVACDLSVNAKVKLDPVWHQRMVMAGNATAMDKAASEMMRMMRDLARLRDAAATILGRISAGHIPGLPCDDADAYPPSS